MIDAEVEVTTFPRGVDFTRGERPGYHVEVASARVGRSTRCRDRRGVFTDDAVSRRRAVVRRPSQN